MSIHSQIKGLRQQALQRGVKLPMSRLSDAIARAAYGRPYSAAIAAERAGDPPQCTITPAAARAVAEQYGIAPDAMAALLAAPCTDTVDGEIFVGLFELDAGSSSLRCRISTALGEVDVEVDVGADGWSARELSALPTLISPQNFSPTTSGLESKPWFHIWALIERQLRRLGDIGSTGRLHRVRLGDPERTWLSRKKYPLHEVIRHDPVPLRAFVAVTPGGAICADTFERSGSFDIDRYAAWWDVNPWISREDVLAILDAPATRELLQQVVDGYQLDHDFRAAGVLDAEAEAAAEALTRVMWPHDEAVDDT